MRKSTARVALVGAALLVLGVMGAGAVSAAPGQAPAAAPSASAKPAGGPFDKVLRRMVHATVVVRNADGTVATYQLDRGTIASVGSGTITISEAGGGTATVSTDAATRVRKAGAKSDLSSLAAGDQVSVVSEVQGSTAMAKAIVVPKPLAARLPAPTN